MSRFRMVYLSAQFPNRPHSLPLLAPTAREATQLAETLCGIASWVLLTVTNERNYRRESV